MSTEPRYLGKYELQKRLARGGQGEVWKAFDTRLRRYVAIKLLHADLQSDPDFVSRFEGEARLIASLHHPNIVQIHDFQLDYAANPYAPLAYMVMDYIEGPTLADYIRNTSRKMQFPDAADIVYIFTAISLALDYAHSRGMIHRDIKPANVLLDQRSPRRNPLGEPILTDFGIAKLQGAGGSTTKVLGTPLYVSPEQAQGHAGDKRSDLYSLGIILYEMTTGVTPFRGDSLLVILMQHLQEIPTPPALINPNIPPALSEVILKSIAKKPADRFSSASAMTIALAEALNVPVPAELSRSTSQNGSAVALHNSLHPSQPLGITPIPLTPSAFLSPPSFSASTPALTSTENDRNNENNGQLPSTATTNARSGYAALPQAATDTPSIVIPQTAQPQAPSVLQSEQQPRRKRKTLQFVLLGLLIAIIAGSGLLYTVFALHKTPSSSSSSDAGVGLVRFLSVSMPNVRPGTIDEVEISIAHIHAAPANTHYYAWLQTSNVAPPIHWLLTPQNGSLSSSYTNTQLLANPPYQLLITAEQQDNGVPSFNPNAQIYYASLSNIQPSSTFTIRMCPGGSNSVCTP